MQLRMASESMAGQEMSQMQNVLLGTEESRGEEMKVTKQQLENLYLGQGLSFRQCAASLGLPTSGGVQWLMKKFNIPARPQLQTDKWNGGAKPRDIHKQTITCTQCGNPLDRFPSLIRENNFCNHLCRGEWLRQDLTGKKFGLLTVIEKAEKDKWGHIQWKCLCECGGEKIVHTGDLLGGKVKSCGCQRYPKGEANYKWTGKIDVPCANPGCSKTKSIYASYKGLYNTFYCSQKCHGEHVTILGSRKGANSSRYVERVKVPCAYCGEKLEKTLNYTRIYAKSFCNVDCQGKWISENNAGSNNANWRGGLSFEPYPTTWNFRLRETIRDRDGRECQVCGKLENGERLAVHHIDYEKTNIVPENLIALCHTCHSKTTIHRDKWQTFFEEQRDGLKIATN